MTNKKFNLSKILKIINSVATSAILALILSIIFGGVDIFQNIGQDQQFTETKQQLDEIKQTVKQLDEIRQSLSTRFLGTFPDYLTDINRVFKNVQPQDTVIIFEDVLYYGIKSRPKEFREFNSLLINHARHGGKVIVAYYNNHPEKRYNSVFHRMIVESRISMNYIPSIQNDREQELKKIPKEKITPKLVLYYDSIYTERYFLITSIKNRQLAENERNGYLSKELVCGMYTGLQSYMDPDVCQLCLDIDSIKQHYLGNGKTINDIHFHDYENMYSNMTDYIASCYHKKNIETIPINEYLTMSCWLIKPANKSRAAEAILAFPSKYSSDEIGFYTQDPNFEKYISMMLNGVSRIKDPVR